MNNSVPVPASQIAQVGRQCQCGYIQYVPVMEPFPPVCPRCNHRYTAIEKDALENLREVLLTCQNFNFVFRLEAGHEHESEQEPPKVVASAR